jgi:hypothetical protein
LNCPGPGARGAWRWLEGVEAPLGESREAWEVSFGEEASPIVRWELAQPTLTVEATVLDDLVAQAPLGRFRVRQRGDFALSDALAIPLPG